MASAGVAVGGMRAVIVHCRRHGHDPRSMRTALDRAIHIVENGLASVEALTRRPPS